MHPIILALVENLGPALIAVVGGAVLRQFKEERDLEKIRRSVKGAVAVLGPIAARTPNVVDDFVVKVLKRAEEELGRPLHPSEAARARNMALALEAENAGTKR